ELHEREPRDEAADVRRVGHATLLRAAAEHAESAYELEEEPEPERDVCGHGREYSEDDDVDAVARVEKYVAPEHARDSARRAEARHERLRGVVRERDRREDVRERREHAAD